MTGHDSGQSLLPFEPAQPPTSPPRAPGTRETSRAARVAALPRAGTLRFDVLRWIQSRGEYGSTDEECQRALGLMPQTQTPRRLELVRFGLVQNSGRQRPTRAGCKAIVWTAVVAVPAQGVASPCQ